MRRQRCTLAFLAVLTLSVHAAASAEPARTDRYGDPMPEGAIMRLGTLRFCQPFPWGLAYSPDGKILFSGGADRRIRGWDPETGKEVCVFEGHTDQVNAIALSADGKWLASGSQDDELIFWEVATGKKRQRIQAHKGIIERLALSPDGKVLAASGFTETLGLWDTDTGKEMRSLPIHRGYRIGAMTFSPDSKRLAFENRPELGIQLVDVATGKLIRAFKVKGGDGGVRGLAFTAHGAALISGGFDKTIRAWDVTSGKELRRYGDEKEEVTCLALAPDEKTLTYGTHPGGMVHIWDLAKNRDLVPPWKANQWTVVSIAYSPDSKKVALSRDVIAIHETASGKRLNPLSENDSGVFQIEHAANGNALAVWRGGDETIELWDTAKWRKTAALHPKVGRFTSLACSPGGKYLTTAEGDGNQGILCQWNPQTGQRQKEFPQGQGWLYSLSYAADGQTFVAIHMTRDRSFLRWDTETGTERGRLTIPRGSNGRNPQLSPDGRLIACTTFRNVVVLWDISTSKELRHFGQTLAGSRDLLQFSPDGRTIATSGGKGLDGRMEIHPDVVLWETATGEERLQLGMNDGLLMKVAYSPDGRLLAAVGRTETIHLWDTWTGKEVGRFTGHRGWMNSLSFAPDGKTLASGGADSTVLIWDVSKIKLATNAEDLSSSELARCWDELAGSDATRAYRSMAALAQRPAQAERLLADKLTSHPKVSAESLTRLVAALDNDDFKTRETASKELARLGPLAVGALRKAMEDNPTVESKRRIEALLARLESKENNPQRHRLLRAIEVLERLGSPQAQRLLDKLAKEATEVGVAREAKASLERLRRTHKRTP